jgi:hypothetical protein
MRNLTADSTLGRILAGLVMGGIALALIVLTAVLGPIGAVALVHPMVELTLPAAAIVTVAITALSCSVRMAWGRLCLLNGVVSLALVNVSVEIGQPLWPSDPLYERTLDQGVKWWLTHVIRATTAYSAATILIAAVLFALSYWLLRSRHR